MVLLDFVGFPLISFVGPDRQGPDNRVQADRAQTEWRRRGRVQPDRVQTGRALSIRTLCLVVFIGLCGFISVSNSLVCSGCFYWFVWRPGNVFFVGSLDFVGFPLICLCGWGDRLDRPDLSK